MTIEKIKADAANLQTTIGTLGRVSYDLYDKAIHELDENEYQILITEYISKKHEYEPEKQF